MLEIKSCVHCGEHVNAIATVAKRCKAGGLMMHLSIIHVRSAMFSETHLARIWMNGGERQANKPPALCVGINTAT